jgi:hypothetical protein
MLANDPDEAAHQAEAFLKDQPLSAYYDEIAIKGLALAQLDVNRGALSHERRVQIKEAVQEVIDDLADHTDPSPASTVDGDKVAEPPHSGDDLAPAWREQAVMCIAGRGLLDEAAAAMLAQLLEKQRIGARVVSSDDVAAATMFRLDVTGAQIVCLSYLEPGGFTNARYLVRRLRRKLPRTKIIVGFWLLTEEDAVRRMALQETGADLVATSLQEAVDEITAVARDAAGSLIPSTLPTIVRAIPAAV